jgi:hypothetical protein
MHYSICLDYIDKHSVAVCTYGASNCHVHLHVHPSLLYAVSYAPLLSDSHRAIGCPNVSCWPQLIEQCDEVYKAAVVFMPAHKCWVGSQHTMPFSLMPLILSSLETLPPSVFLFVFNPFGFGLFFIHGENIFHSLANSVVYKR